MTEDQLELETLGWPTEVGYSTLHGPDSRLMVIALSGLITGRWCWWSGCARRWSA